MSSQFSRLQDYDAPPLSTSEFEALRSLIVQETGISLGSGKRELVRSRLRKRLQAVGVGSYREYHQYLQSRDSSGAEKREMINSITTNKTSFFREQHHFQFLSEQVLPELVEAARRNERPKKLRIWSAACSTGQEPYSIAIALQDFFARHPGWDKRILASDIDSECLKKASTGVYNSETVLDLPTSVKKRHFLRGTGSSKDKVSVRAALRNAITFRRINFADADWPIQIKFDVIFCRNAMIYFERDFQESLLEKFLCYLNPGGYLILGHSENVSWMNKLEPLGQTIYRPAVGSQGTKHTSASGCKPSGIPAKYPIKVPPAVPTPPTKKRSIIAGEVFASDAPIEITTLLGSCVATCLFDPDAKVGGMNHFLLPEGCGENANTACYGIHAMDLLIAQLLSLGADRERLVARLYGGGNVMKQQLQQSRVGEKNIDFVRKYLTTDGIPIVYQQVGGERALHVSMTANTGVVKVKKITSSEEGALANSDRAALLGANTEMKIVPENQITLF